MTGAIFVALLAAQEIDVKGSLGATAFLDAERTHVMTGGSARFYLTRRFSIEPEVLFHYESASHHDWTVVPNFAWDFRTGRVRPYITGGIGWLSYVQRFRGAPPGTIQGFSESQWHVTFGFGTKVYLNNGWFIAPEFRIGFEPHVRFSAGIGYTFRHSN